MTDQTRRTADAEALAELLGERARDEGVGQEPTTEELVAHLEGRLPDEETADLERRLAASPEATRDLLDLAELMAVEETLAQDDDPPADLEVEKGWRDFRGRLGSPGGREAPVTPVTPVTPRRPAAALARFAAVAVAALALGVWVGGVWFGSGGPEGPAALEGVGATATLFADRSGQLATVELAPGERVLLTLDPGERCPEYRVEIDGAGSLSGLTRDPSGSLVVLFAGAPGSHQVRVLGCQPERELASYRLDVVAPDG